MTSVFIDKTFQILKFGNIEIQITKCWRVRSKNFLRLDSTMICTFLSIETSYFKA